MARQQSWHQMCYVMTPESQNALQIARVICTLEQYAVIGCMMKHNKVQAHAHNTPPITPPFMIPVGITITCRYAASLYIE